MKQQIKLTIALCLGIAIMLGGCKKDKYDDAELRKTIEEQQKKADEQQRRIETLEALMAALENNDYITAITPITEAGAQVGYTITFSNSPTITVYNSSVTSITQNNDGTATFTLAVGNKITMPFALGAGTEADPRKIFNAADLNAMRNNLGWHYILMVDITVTDWLPVGDRTTSSNVFSGSLDGNGHTITINSFGYVPKSGNSYYYGLFGWIRNGGKVSKLHVAYGNVGTIRKTDGGIEYGGIASRLNDSSPLIVNCSVSGDISAVGTSSWSIYVGGIVGSMYGGTMQNCYATGSLSATDGTYNSAGGITCYITGDGSITACVALQTVINNGGDDTRSGRVVANMGGGYKIEKNYAYNTMQVNGAPIATGTGTATKHGANSTSANWSLESWWTDTGTYGLGWDNTIWDFTDISADSYPKLR